MYKAIHNKDGSLKHSQECNMSFGNKDPQCPRCAELLNGAPTRNGWQKDFYSAKKQQELAQLESIKVHFSSHRHLSGGCGTVCTFGEH